MRYLNLLLASLMLSISSYAQVMLNLDVSSRSHVIGDKHYGIFFEEINHAGDGGLYAELVRNRSFEDNDNNADAWRAGETTTSLSLITDGLLNSVQRNALHVDVADAKGGNIYNEGFWGMHFVNGETYKASFWVKSDAGYNGNIILRLYSQENSIVGTQSVSVSVNGEWQKVETEITATENAPKGYLGMMFLGNSSVDLDVVSLFPPTFKDRPNGCRRDLAQMLADMHPSFMRFPGGCYIEGEWRNNLPHYNQQEGTWSWGSPNRFEWKQTIGSIENRPGHWNVNWNYRVSDGLGFHEMLQLSEDIGAEPLFVVNMGMGHGWSVPYNNIEEYIQEALDALEYCNGDVTTPYGALRAANGHPAPFNLRLIEIGNENYNFTAYDNRDQSDHYAERYIQIYKAIKEKYPDCVCIGDVEAWGTDNPSWRNEHPVDAVDEHYYRNPSWFVGQYEKYNAYDRSKMKKVYAGEYAVTSDFGSHGNLNAALGEAVYMQGMENNSDICIMNSYAPIFVNENDQKWMPDMIRFNSYEAYGTPSYYVQKLMASNVGKQNITWTEQNNRKGEDAVKRTGLSTWSTSAKFYNFTVTRADGTVYTAKFDNTENWKDGGGSWSEEDGVLTQSSTSMQGKLYINMDESLDDDYTIELDAEKTGGAEGFLIAFNYIDDKNYCWWNIGGWNNSKHAVEVCRNGTKSTVSEAMGYLINDNPYHLTIEVRNGMVKCYIDGTLYHSFALPASDRKVYVSSNINDDTKKLYVKIVNPYAEAQTTTVNLKNAATKGGRLIQMTSASGDDQNTNIAHLNVVPTETVFPVSGSKFELDIPAYSFNIIVLDVVNADEESVVEDGAYFFYDSKAQLFLSRGADWGTRATMDSYGVPVNIEKTAEDCYTLKYADQTNKWFGGTLDATPYPYTDLSGEKHITWQLQQVGYGEYRLYNISSETWLAAGTESNGCVLTKNMDDAIVFSLLDAEGYQYVMSNIAANKPAGCDTWRTTDVTELMENPGMTTDFSGWDASFTGNGMGKNFNSGLAEIYQGYGAISQTLTGMKPGWYRFSLSGFFRDGSNANCSLIGDMDMPLGNAFIFANGDKQRMMPWATDRIDDGYPNSMSEAAAAIADEKYYNEVYTKVGEDGVLTVGINVPQYNPMQWLIWGNAALTYLAEPVDYTSKIVNPSFENGLTGWTYSNMQMQTNNEPSAMKVGSTYAEKWMAAPNTLTGSFLRQTITGLPDGDYVLSANCHAELQTDKSLLPDGVYLYAGNDLVKIAEARKYQVKFSLIGGEVEIGFLADESNVNWITVDDFHLQWVGNPSSGLAMIVLKAMQKLQVLLQEKDILPDEMRAEAEGVLQDARAMLEKADGNTPAEDFNTALSNVNEQYEKCKAYRIPVERNDPYARYLFAYFPSNSDENLYYAVSEDAFHYVPLNEGQRIMSSDSVAVKKGIRDPHVLRGQDGAFYMVATDMRCAEGWDSNRGIVMYRSTDLIHWTHHTVHFPTRFPEWKNVTRVWAPATVWDPEYDNGNGTKGRYMIYYSLLTNDGKCRYDKVFYSYANDDFSDLLTEPVFLFDRGSATIDADIIYDETDRLYHMIYKNEGSGGICSVTAKRLTAEAGAELGSQWSKPSASLQQTTVAVEGGGLFRLINSNTWVMMYDCYGSGRYEFCTTNDWETFKKEAETTMYGAFTPRHGSVIPVTPAEYNALLQAFPTTGLEEIEIATGVHSISAAARQSVSKQLTNNRIVIYHNGKRYNALGMEM